MTVQQSEHTGPDQLVWVLEGRLDAFPTSGSIEAADMSIISHLWRPLWRVTAQLWDRVPAP